MKPEAEGSADSWESVTSRTVADTLRKLLVGSVGTLLTTEEGIRAAVRDLKLPKEVVASVLTQAESTKAAISEAIGREIRAFLGTMDAQRLVNRALENLVLEVKAEVRFRAKENGELQPEFKVESKPRGGHSRSRKQRRSSLDE